MKKWLCDSFHANTSIIHAHLHISVISYVCCFYVDKKNFAKKSWCNISFSLNNALLHRRNIIACFKQGNGFFFPGELQGSPERGMKC